MLSSKTNALLTHTLASFWRKQSCIVFTFEPVWDWCNLCKVIQSCTILISLQWCLNECDDVSYHQPRDCLLNHLFRRRSNKISKLRVTGLCAGNSPLTCKFPAQKASNAENVSIWWRHHVISRRNKVHNSNINIYIYIHISYSKCVV